MVVFRLLWFCCWLLIEGFCGGFFCLVNFGGDCFVLLGVCLLTWFCLVLFFCVFVCLAPFVKFTEKNKKWSFLKIDFFPHPAPNTSFLPM